MRVMSIPGPIQYSSAGTTRSPFGPRMTIDASSATRAGAVSDGLTRDAAVGVEDRVLAVHRGRRVGVADVAAGAVAGPAAAVVPAARVLRDVAAERALVADLRRGDQLRRFHQQAELFAHQRVLDDFRERRHRADLEAAVGFLDALELFDLPEVDDRLRLLQAILEPVHAVEPAGQHQRVGAVLVEQLDRIVDTGRLVQLKNRHYVADNGHVRTSVKCAP